MVGKCVDRPSPITAVFSKVQAILPITELIRFVSGVSKASIKHSAAVHFYASITHIDYHYRFIV